jgi:hypothetical protein
MADITGQPVRPVGQTSPSPAHATQRRALDCGRLIRVKARRNQAEQKQ